MYVYNILLEAIVVGKGQGELKRISIAATNPPGDNWQGTIRLSVSGSFAYVAGVNGYYPEFRGTLEVKDGVPVLCAITPTSAAPKDPAIIRRVEEAISFFIQATNQGIIGRITRLRRSSMTVSAAS